MSKSKIDSVFYVAAAGAGKTQRLVDMVYQDNGKKVLLTTYTRQNTKEIFSRFARNGIPNNVSVMPWFTFLIQQCIRPYQGVWSKARIAGLHWIEGQSGVCYGNDGRVYQQYGKQDVRYFVDSKNQVYSDKAAQLAIEINKACGGEVISRLARAYSSIYVDEVQDMVGYDLELLREISRKVKHSAFAGDPRQVTYSTHYDKKNKKYGKGNIVEFFREKCKSVHIDETTLVVNHRSDKSICELANTLYPDLPSSCSDAWYDNPHIGIFCVRPSSVEQYVAEYAPMQLRDSVRVPVSGNAQVQNFGDVKGRAFNDVLIYPTVPMQKWLLHQADAEELKAVSRARLYVAITRARRSVCFVLQKGIVGSLYE